MFRVAALEQTVAKSARPVQLGVQIEFDLVAEENKDLLLADATSERLVELKAEFAAQERLGYGTVRQKTSHPDTGQLKAVAPKHSATAQRVSGWNDVERRAAVYHVEVPGMHRTVDEGRVGRSRAHAHLNDGGAEVRRRARHCAHGQVGVENENSTDSPGMPRKLFRKGSHVSHVDSVLRLPIGRGGRCRRSTGFELSYHLIEALRESLGRAPGRVAPVSTLDVTCGAVAHTD